MRVVRKDGTERLWLYRNVLYVEPGARPYVLGTPSSRSRGGEESSDKATSRRSEATSRLAGRAAYAFNNLLTVIIGSAGMPLADKPLIARVPWIAIYARSGARRHCDRQLLAVGRQQPIDRTALDLNAVVARLESSLRHVAGSDATLTPEPRPTLPHIDGDSAQIEQVLLHLAGNAATRWPRRMNRDRNHDHF